MITKQQALAESEFHENGTCRRYRRNGTTQTWKSRPAEWRVPVKFGLRPASIWHDDAFGFHPASTCPEGRH
jgi:hypothetical protein